MWNKEITLNKNLNNFNVLKLKQICKYLKISNYSKKNKQQLKDIIIDLIDDNYKIKQKKEKKKIYFPISFTNKDIVKNLGACFDFEVKKWYYYNDNSNKTEIKIYSDNYKNWLNQKYLETNDVKYLSKNF